MVLSVLAWSMTTGCAPPPLIDEKPGIDILFPQSRQDITICPDLVVVVDVSSFPLGVPDENGPGHWHLKDASGAFLQAASDPWMAYSLGPDHDFETPRLTALSVALAEFDHNELNTAEYPDAVAAVEFYVGATEDCVGQIPDDADTGGD